MSDRNIAGEGATGTPIDLDKMRSLTVLGMRSRPRVSETRNAVTGERSKSTTDELGTTVTEHSARGSGVSDRQDVTVRPASINLKVGKVG
jgi:hypothetical protein